MSKTDIKLAMTVGWVAGMLVLIGYSIYTFGRIDGYRQSSEDTKRIKCEIEFSGQPLKEIDGKCIKYFTEQE